MELFSERYGYKKKKDVIQTNSIDEELRNSLWNALDIYYWNIMDNHVIITHCVPMDILTSVIWVDYFKKPRDNRTPLWSRTFKELREYYFSCAWYEVYDFIQFIANNDRLFDKSDEFIRYCNEILKRELSAYRFINQIIVPISSKDEVASIEEATAKLDSSNPISIHINTALSFLSDRKNPQYRNSIKESISAVEAACEKIASIDHATLDQALAIIQKQGKIQIHPALNKAFGNLYGYTSNAEGIRHALMEEPNLDFEDAKFMLVSCSAFINYLKEKAAKSGISLT